MTQNPPQHLTQITKDEMIAYKLKGHAKSFGQPVVDRVAEGLRALGIRDINMFSDDKIREMLRQASIMMKDNGEI